MDKLSKLYNELENTYCPYKDKKIDVKVSFKITIGTNA